MRTILLGPQRFQVTAPAALRSLGVDGPVATINSGWEEREDVVEELDAALDGRADRIQGLESGASDFLTKPIDDVMLFARVRSLTRFTLVIDELRQREASGRRMGVIAGAAARLDGLGGRVLIVDDNERQAQRIADGDYGADSETPRIAAFTGLHDDLLVLLPHQGVGVDLEVLCSPVEGHARVLALCDRLLDACWRLSDEIARQYFVHAEPNDSMVSA